MQNKLQNKHFKFYDYTYNLIWCTCTIYIKNDFVYELMNFAQFSQRTRITYTYYQRTFTTDNTYLISERDVKVLRQQTKEYPETIEYFVIRHF